MELYCSLHCGRFSGVNPERYEKTKDRLINMFANVRYDEAQGSLDLCGAQDIQHEPSLLIEIFSLLGSILDDDGKGQILLNCGTMEMCYFRKNMWKLTSVMLPDDPFEGIHHVKAE